MLTDTFATWAQAETLQNDGLWSLAASSAHTRRLTQRLVIAGIAKEGHADIAEEDAHVAAGDIRETIRECDRDAALMNATLESLGLTGTLDAPVLAKNVR